MVTPKRRGSHLLDGAAAPVAIGIALEAGFILAALAGIGLAADAIHGDGQGLVGLLRDGAEGHGAGGEALDDFGGGLDLFERDRAGGLLDFEQAAQGAELAVLFIDQIRVFLECLRIPLADGMLELADGERVQQVMLAAHAVLIIAAHGQFGVVAGDGLEGERVLHLRFAGQHIEPDAFDAGGGAGEVLLDQSLVQADGFEDLRAAIALQGGDAHFREGLKQAFVDGLLEIAQCLFESEAVGQIAAQGHVFQGFDGQVRVHGTGAVTDQEGEVHDLTRLAGFDNQGDLGTGFLAHQVVMDGGEGEEAGDGSVLFVEAAVGKDQQRVAGLDGQRGAAAERIEGALEVEGAIFGGLAGAGIGGAHGEEGGQRGGEEIAVGDAAQLFERAVAEDGMGQLERVAVARGLIKNIALCADVANERHNHLFADGIDGRVGDLGEELLEIVEQGLGAVGEAGERRIGAHGADGLLAIFRHGGEDHFQILVGVAEGALAAEDGVVIGMMLAGRLGKLIESDLVFGQPLGVGLAGVEALLGFLVGDDAAGHGIDQEHLAGLEAAFAFDVAGGDGEDAGFR